jgi:hypothetical protein
MININDYYWKADDGRVYGSKNQTIVTDADPEYVEWSTGQRAQIWPRELDGTQTEAAMQDVLNPFGNLFVNLEYYTAHARRVKYAEDITVNGMPFSTDPVTMGSLNTAQIYTGASPDATFSWKLSDGSFITLTAPDIVALQAAVAQFGQDCFACEDTVLTGIETGTITTRAEIDAAFSAVSNSFTGLKADPGSTRHGKRK